MPTPTAESPPMTEASQTTSRASSRTDFHIGGLPPLRGRSTRQNSCWFLALASRQGNFDLYGTAQNPSSLSSNPRAQTTDVLTVGPNFARVSDGASTCSWIGPQRPPRPPPEQSLGCGTEQH